MYVSRFRRICCNHRQQRRYLTSVTEYILSHHTEATWLLLAASVGRNLQLEMRTRLQAQSVAEEKRRSEEEKRRHCDEIGELKEKNDVLQKANETNLERERRLKDSISARGVAGEQVLKQILEEARQQKQIKNVDWQERLSNGKIPDAVIELEGGAKVVVDSKAPEAPNELLSGFLNGADENIRDIYIGKLKSHIRDLSDKRYHAEVPEGFSRTIMMLPGEGYLYAAYGPNGVDDKKLHATAAEANVMLVGPNGLRSIIQLISLQEAEKTQAIKLGDANVQEVLHDRLQPLWTNDILPKLRKMTLDLGRFVETTNKLGENIISFDEQLRSKEALDIDKAKKSKLPKEVSQPNIFELASSKSIDKHKQAYPHSRECNKVLNTPSN